ncbi:hypothetical protein FY528_03510 [Hymenobacter lutimineralis]|uniref:PorT family protein n=1 Tax=Hymenobacter lutimineralis TaxID=2606448 RepID=A0A5D6VFJ0_9BACT|nr:hypothetical protein [Hymenobacter lutimineralis]TYZ13488.1 hypothetical protein FY528_03510 [Hymenobacter lutimineralis]
MRIVWLTLLLVGLSSLSVSAWAQAKGDWSLIASPGISYQKQIFGEINAMYANVQFGPGAVLVHGPRIGLEAGYRDHLVYAPKIGYEFDFILVALRANLVGYVDQGQVDLRLLPEAGLSFFGFANFTYGYNAPLGTYRTPATSLHRLTLTANLLRD